MKLFSVIGFAGLLLLLFNPIWAQAQNKIPLKYEGTVVDQRGFPVKNGELTLKGTIFQDRIGGPIAYQETRVTRSDESGNFNEDFGRGQRVEGSAEQIDLSQNRYFFMVEIQTQRNGSFALAYARPILSEKESITIVAPAPVTPAAATVQETMRGVRVVDGSIYLDSNTKSVIMTSPDQQCWRLMITNTGDLITQAIQCPQ